VRTETREKIDIHGGLCSDRNFFSINLLRNSICSMKERKALLFALNTILIAALVGSIFLSINLHNNNQILERVKIGSQI